MFRNNYIIKPIYNSLSRLPTPINISYFWNFGSCVGFFLIIQILSRLFLTIHYISDINLSFNSINHIVTNINGRWIIRYIHINRASFFVCLIYLHVIRGVYYKRYSNLIAWIIRVILLILSMLTAFLRYVLPWRQISFWRATVITNIISSIPYFRKNIVFWLWGRYSVRPPTLTRFYTFHFIFPLIIVLFSFLHLFYIHSRRRSRNPLRFFSSIKIDFWPFFRIKDILRFFFLFFFFFFIVFFFSDIFSDPDNYIKANFLTTPDHIKPEWYFLFAYAILRCIPNKLFRVLALLFSILVFFLIPFLTKNLKITFFYQFFFWLWVFNFFLLTWLRRCVVKDIFNYLSQLRGFFYFFLLFILCIF